MDTGLIARARCVSIAMLVAWMAGCGDGATPPPGGGGAGGWESGVFQPAATFQSLCEEPRTGINPATNRPYPDVQGTTTDENNFLRSYSNDTYLWYDEIADRNPALFDSPILYFGELNGWKQFWAL